MAYTPTTWNNGASPAINAPNLNKIESGIVEAHRLAELSPFLNDFRITPGENVLISLGTSKNTTSLTYTTILTAKLPYKGSFRLKFNAYTNVTGRAGNLYVAKNGVQVSSTYPVTSNDPLSISYDVANYNAGDVVTIAAKTDVDNGSVYVSLIGVYVSQVVGMSIE